MFINEMSIIVKADYFKNDFYVHVHGVCALFIIL